MLKHQKFQKQKSQDVAQNPKQFSKWALDSLSSKNEKTKIEPNNDYLDKFNDHQLDENDDPDEYEDDEEEEDDESVDSIHPYGPDVDPKKLLHSLTSSHNSQEIISHFSNAPISPITRKYPYLDDMNESIVPLPGAPRDVQAQIIKPRFVTLSWLEPVKNPDEVVSYSVFYKMNSSDR